MPLRDTRGFAEALTAAYLGLDLLYRAAHPEDRWGLVVLNLAGHLEAEPFEGFDGARGRFNLLRAEAERLPEPDRRRYYQDLCDSALTVIAWQEQPLTLEEQIRGLLAARPIPASDEILQGLRKDMLEQLGALGFRGDLHERCAAWEAENRVPPEAIEREMKDLIVEARDRSERLFGAIERPSPNVELVSGAQFNARCDFARGTIEVNRDPVITRASLKHLTLHEVFPGHCLQFEWRERAYHDGWGFADGLLSLVKSAGSPLFEGIADAGGLLLDWADENDHVGTLLTRYHAGLGTLAAWRIHSDNWSLEQAREWLVETGLVGGAGWVENRLAYIAPAGRGAHVWSYWLGEQRLREVLEGSPLDAERMRFLFGRMHSLASVAMGGFDAASA